MGVQCLKRRRAAHVGYPASVPESGHATQGRKRVQRPIRRLSTDFHRHTFFRATRPRSTLEGIRPVLPSLSRTTCADVEDTSRCWIPAARLHRRHSARCDFSYVANAHEAVTWI